MGRRLVLPLVAGLLAMVLPGPSAAAEPIRVVCTLPHLGAIARDIGGERVEVKLLADPRQDPHYVSPTTQLMARTNQADLFVELGMSLELWSERVLDGARNPAIRIGQQGHVYAARGIRPLDVPLSADRAQGDIHPEGNPHVWLNPLNGKVLAENIAAGLIRVDPAGEPYYRERLAAFSARVDQAFYGEELLELLGAPALDRLQRGGTLFSFLETKQFKGKPLKEYAGGWLQRVLPFRGQKFISYHKSWVYFSDAFGLQVAGQLEPKPGIPPSTAHLAAIEELIEREGVRLLVTAPYYDPTRAERVAERTGARAVVVPTEPAEGESYVELFDRILDLVLPPLEEAGK